MPEQSFGYPKTLYFNACSQEGIELHLGFCSLACCGRIKMAEPIVIAKNDKVQSSLLPQLANRHGCITGATGTGKTVTLQVLAESFSRMGTPVFMADVKGDLSGISQAATPSPKLPERLNNLGLPERSEEHKSELQSLMRIS